MAANKTALDQLSQQFHMMVGFCIAEWARIDDHLFNIFHQCVGAPLKQCAIIYYRTPGLDLRLGLTDEIVKSVLPVPARKSGGQSHPLVKEWASLQKDIRELLTTRRRIAHHPVTVRVAVGGAIGAVAIGKMALGAMDVVESFAIYASETERLRTKEADQSALTVDDMSRHLEAVNQIWPKLYRFYIDLIGELYAKSPPQEPLRNSETSKDRVKGGAELRKRRPRSSRT